MASSSIDSKGIIQILFGNNSINSIQSISELYHNSDDSNASCVSMYSQKVVRGDKSKIDEWFVFRDNGDGMDMNNMEKYLTLLNVDTEKEIANKHGKYSFGGKQAVFQLAGITNIDKSDRAIIISKKESGIAVCCEFVMHDLIKYGWSNTIKPCLSNEDNNNGYAFSNFISTVTPCFNKPDYHGTSIFIKMNVELKKLLDYDYDYISYMVSVKFFKCLERCKFKMGLDEKNLTEIKIHDPLYYDRVSDKYKKTVIVEWYSDKTDDYFVIDNEYLPFSKKGNLCRLLRPFDKKDMVKQNEFIIQYSMIYEILHKPKNTDEIKIEEDENEDLIYLCRNDAVVGTYPRFKHPVHRTSHNENIPRWCRMRICIKSPNSISNNMDKIFGINMNKCSILFDSIPRNLQKTMIISQKTFINSVKKHMATEFPTQPVQKIIKESIPKPPIPIVPHVADKKTNPTPHNVKTPNPKPSLLKEKIKESIPKPLIPNVPHVTDKKTSSTPHNVNIPKPELSLVKEKTIQAKLFKAEGGQIEVRVNNRYIDLLTDKYVIEIKRYNDRLDALKVLYYSEHYPDHRSRIHLFRVDGSNCPIDPIFESVCNKANIKLTYEN